ncbi:uncharacterized protein LOC141907754 [Tubulanus polymorphus]|uniref:uncharacterized protein LOC141907754 n=1 Tax=Tubulanus polymorphus TaxID=672921 RepID=UPI003DA6117F
MAENSATEKSGVGVKLSRAGRSANRRVANALTSACDTAIREHDLLKASINLNNLKRKFSQLEMIDAHLLDEIQSDNEIEQFILEAEDYLNNLNGSIFKFNREIGKMSSLEKQSPVRSTEIKTALLPKLQHPNYNGNLKEWPTFWGLFETSVHLNSQFSEIEKFSYLKSAVSLLKTRFGQNHKISQAYLSALVDLSPPNNEQSSLRKFYDECNCHMRQLNALGTSHDNYGAIFELEIIESTVSLDVKDVSNCTITEPTSTVSQLFLSTGAQNSKKKFVFCEGLHASNECTVVNDVKKRMEILRNKSLCFNCLGDKHHAGNCKSKYSCRMCKKRHHTSICFQTRETPYSVPNSRGVNFSVEEGQNRGIGNEKNRIKSNMTNSVTTQSSSVPIFETESLIQSDDHIETQTVSQNISLCNSFGNVLLKTAVVNIENPYSGSIVSCNTLFDDGSQRSFMTAKMASQLGLKSSRTETLDLGAFGSQNSKVRTLDVVKICIECENSYLIEVSVLVVPMITRPLDMGGFLEIPEFKDLNLANPIHSECKFEVQLLIGSDHYYDFVSSEIIRSKQGPVAIKSCVGYLVSGPTGTSNDKISIMSVLSYPEFSLNCDEIGIEKLSDESFVDKYICDFIWKDNDGRYNVKLPWKTEHDTLTTNYCAVVNRTKSTLKKLSKTPEILKIYSAIIDEQLRRDYIEIVPVDDLHPSSRRVHYLAHHPVYRQSNTTPIRIVFDCSFGSPSLNDSLEPGPALQNDLTGILLRFRLNEIGLCADIEKAFLQIGIDPEDRDVTRFVWFREPGNPDSELVTYRFKRVLFGATCSPFILNCTILHHLRNQVVTENCRTSSDILRNIYVDNILTSCNSEENSLDYLKSSREIFSLAGMNLRSWSSNSEEVRSLAESEKVLEYSNHVNSLGLNWSIEQDIITFKGKVILDEFSGTTKRTIVQNLAKIYDPFGLILPISIRGKILIQTLWRESYDWDTPVPEKFGLQWQRIVSDLNYAIRNMHLKRINQ